MPTLEETRAAVVTVVNAYADAIFAAQAARLETKGSYLQRLPTHTTVPTDGGTLPPDNVSVHPTDETETGEEYFTFPPQMHTCASVSVTDGPGGKTFVCAFEFDWTATGMRQRYTITGPDRVVGGWTEYDPDAQPI